MRVVVTSVPRDVFSDITLVIHPLGVNQNGYAALRQPGPGAEKCWYARSFVQFDGYWVEIVGQCPDSALYPYEVGDVLVMLRATDASKMPATFSLGQCGGPPVFKSVDEFLRALTKPVTIGERRLPEIRGVERKRLVEARRREEQRKREAVPILD
jgi:hypothetical protein